MEEKKYTNQRIIKVILTAPTDDKDVLRFYIHDKEPIDINLNSETSQQEIKILFSELLRISFVENITFDFKPDDEYTKELYKDVCVEYIKEIESELNQCRAKIRDELYIE